MFTYSPVILINATAINTGFTLQQNPVSDEMILNNISPSLLNTEATITNNTGAVIKKFTIRSRTQTINVEDLPVGIYYVHTFFGNVKLLINR